MGYKIGDKVVYPHHGAAVIQKRERRVLDGKRRSYLVLRLASSDLTLMVPEDKTEDIGIRQVISKEDVKKVFKVFKQPDNSPSTNWSRRYKANIEKLKSGDVFEVAEVVRNLAIRDKERGLSTGERRMFSRAKEILVSELCFALNCDPEQAERELEKHLP
ncbi:MAG: CarD family transcriptional regulator [Acidimicrobiia bacterium]